MSKKWTKFEKLQRYEERLENPDETRIEPEIPELDRFGEAEASAEQEAKIRQRAYELYENRGKEHGHDVEDWLKAEAEILGTKRKPAAA